MFTSAYSLGSYQGLRLLGLTKFAMMLPPPTAAAKAIGARAGRKGVQTAESAVAGGLAAKETAPVMQHIKALGAPHPNETQTSQWFRGELLGQASPQQMLAGSGLGQAAPRSLPPRGTSQTMIPTSRATMRPTGRPGARPEDLRTVRP